MPHKTTAICSFLTRAGTILDLFRYFIFRRRWIMLPFLILLLICGILLVVTGGLSYVAPFVYGIF